MKIKLGVKLVLFYTLAFIFVIEACSEDKGPLPILGKRLLDESGDTIYHTIPKFSFINQDSTYITDKTYRDKVYVADFFFTSCPTICPKMAAQMLRIYNRYKDDDRVLLLSHSVDPVRDSVPRLKEYAEKLGVSADKWSFVTGIKTEIYDIAEDYFSIAMEDTDAPGGYNHSGRLILVDWDGRLRSFCDGTDSDAVDKLMKDIDRLLKEYEGKGIK